MRLVISGRDCPAHRTNCVHCTNTVRWQKSQERSWTWRQRQARRPGPRRALTEDEILDAALALLDEGGPTAASIRGIAARVGVAPNAVYTYFPDKAAVVKALVERLLGEVDHDVFADREPALAAAGGGPRPGAAGAADRAPGRGQPDDRRARWTARTPSP